ncbi:MAG: NUDIX domain-containing protein [Patescibacteria group bacterium]
MEQFIAGRALITYKDKVLVIRESQKYKGGTNIGKYDLPGGKISPGEDFREGLIREVQEECGLEVTLGNPFYLDEWHPIIEGKEIQIIGIFLQAIATTDEVKLSDDHDDYRWISPAEHEGLPLMEKVTNALKVYSEIIP